MKLSSGPRERSVSVIPRPTVEAMSDANDSTPTSDYDRFDALIFDCDGTLLDTMPAHYRAWLDTLSRHGLSFAEERFYELGGVSAEGVVRILAEEQDSSADAAAVSRQKEERFVESGTVGVEPIAPVVALARRYRGVRPMAVATGGLRVVCERLLKNAGIADWFDIVVTADDVRHGKPAPDTYALAAKRLGVDPRRCVAFEDAGPGLESARAAGMVAVDVRPWRR